MENTKKIGVLSAFEEYLEILKAYNTENFERGDRTQFVRNVCFAFVVTIFVVMIPIVSILGVWYIIDCGGGLNMIFAAIPMILTILQLFVTFFVLAPNSRIIGETIERIRTIVDQRKCHFFVFFFTREVMFSERISRASSKKYFLIFIHFITPIGRRQSHQIYNETEERSTLITTFLAKMTGTMVVTVFSIEALLPISYAIFGYPPQQLWVLPIELQ